MEDDEYENFHKPADYKPQLITYLCHQFNPFNIQIL